MTLHIPANDHGQIRIFALDGSTPDDLKEKTPEALRAIFGTDALDPTYVDVVTRTDRENITLIDYLNQGYDIPPGAVDLASLSTVTGTMIIVMSRAFGGKELTLDLPHTLRLVSTLSDPVVIASPEPIISAGAIGIVGDPPARKSKSDAATGGRVATIALLVLFAIVALMIWVAS